MDGEGCMAIGVRLEVDGERRMESVVCVEQCVLSSVWCSSVWCCVVSLLLCLRIRVVALT